MPKELTKKQKEELDKLKQWLLDRSKLLKIRPYGIYFGISHLYQKLYGCKSGNGFAEKFNLEDIEKLKKAQKEFCEPVKITSN